MYGLSNRRNKKKEKLSITRANETRKDCKSPFLLRHVTIDVIYSWIFSIVSMVNVELDLSFLEIVVAVELHDINILHYE